MESIPTFVLAVSLQGATLDQCAGGAVFRPEHGRLIQTRPDDGFAASFHDGAPEFLGRISFPNQRPNAWELKGIVSRKKQLLPYLLQCLSGVSGLAGGRGEVNSREIRHGNAKAAQQGSRRGGEFSPQGGRK